MARALILSPVMGIRLAPGIDRLVLGRWDDDWAVTVRAVTDSDRYLMRRHPDYAAPARCGTVAGLRDSLVWIVIESASFPDPGDRVEAVARAQKAAAAAPLYVTAALRLAAPGWTGAGPWAIVFDPDEPTCAFVIEDDPWPLRPPYPLYDRGLFQQWVGPDVSWHDYDLDESVATVAPDLFVACLRGDLPDWVNRSLAHFSESYEEHRHQPDDRFLKLMIALEGALLPSQQTNAKEKLAQRTAALVGAALEGRDTCADVRHWYDLRSEIAHGRTPEPHRSLEREVHDLDALVRAAMSRLATSASTKQKEFLTGLDRAAGAKVSSSFDVPSDLAEHHPR